MLKTIGLVLGTGNKDTLIQRAEELTQGHPVMSSLVAKLAEVRRHIAMQVAALDREIHTLVRSEPTLNWGATRLIAFSTLARPGRISSLPASMPLMTRLASTWTLIAFCPRISSANSPRNSGVSTPGGATSTTVTPVPWSWIRRDCVNEWIPALAAQ